MRRGIQIRAHAVVGVLQLHAWDVDEHANLTEPDAAPHGHGVLLWFETTNFDAAVQAARALKAEIVEEPRENPNSGKREIWVRDPDGYMAVVADRRSRSRRQGVRTGGRAST